MKKTVLVVDDSNTNLLMARDALFQEYKVITMSSAAKMFNFLGRVTPDIILLDIEMPETDGYEAIKILKANPKYKDIPVVFLSVHGDEDTKSKCYELGAVDFVVKPMLKPVLLQVLDAHLP